MYVFSQKLNFLYPSLGVVCHIIAILLQIKSPHKMNHTFTTSLVPLMRVGNMHLMMCLHNLRQTSLANPTRVYLEGQLTDDDMHFTGQHLADFMANVGSLKKKMFLNIRKMIKSVFFCRF